MCLKCDGDCIVGRRGPTRLYLSRRGRYDTASGTRQNLGYQEQWHFVPDSWVRQMSVAAFLSRIHVPLCFWELDVSTHAYVWTGRKA